MATVLLQTVGSTVGAAIGGPVGALAGRALGAIAGSAIDQALLSEDQVVTGPRLEGTQILSSVEGSSIPKIYGRNKLSGQIIWATHFEEVINSASSGGGKGSGPKTTTVSYSYFANFAVGICDGPVSLLRRVWADGEELDLTKLDYRFYTGDLNQEPDPLVEAKQGTGNAPAYRGTCYIVFENFPLERFGNRIPQLAFEVVRSIGTLEENIRAITIIPGSTEYGYDTQQVKAGGGAAPYSVRNRHQSIALTDWEASLDELQALCPNLQQVALVVSWFGTDLRAEHCEILPGTTDRFNANWSVGGFRRHTARLISQVDGKPAYGGTPDDASVLRAIADLKSRGLKVVLYPFIMMDVEADALPGMDGNGYQPAYPWRGEISCFPIAGTDGTADKTDLAASQVNAFSARYLSFIEHYLQLAQQAGGVDGFLIGSEFRGLTRVRDANGNFPFVGTLILVADRTKEVLGNDCLVTYGADWSEYFGYHPQDGSNDVLFNLDDLWARPSIDAIGIDNYMPLSDMRNGREPETDGIRSAHKISNLQAHIEAGEGFDWYYRSEEERLAGERSAITDGLGEPWVYRYKDLKSWWSNAHHNRHNGVREVVPTGWAPQSKPFFFTELGCPAVDHGANQPNVFYDPKSHQSALPRFSNGVRDDLIQRRFLQAHYEYWRAPENNPVSSVYGGKMVPVEQIAPWAWDSRPFPTFPLDTETWSDGENWHRGHWLNGRLGACALDDLIRRIMSDYNLHDIRLDLDGLVDGYMVPTQVTARQAIEPLLGLFNAYAFEDAGCLFCSQSLHAKSTAISKSQMVQEDSEPQMSVRRQAELELPAEAMVSHATVFGDYAQTSSKSRRLNGGSDRQISLQLPAVIHEEMAVNLANMRLRDDWHGRLASEITLPTSQLEVGPGDRLSLKDDPEQIQWLVVECEKGVRQNLKLRAILDDHRATAGSGAVYKSPPHGDEYGEPLVVFLDLPALREQDVSAITTYAAVFAKPWSGEYNLLRSATDSAYELVTTVQQPAGIGVLQAPLLPGIEGRIDHKNEIHVKLLSGSFMAAEMLEVLRGGNAVAIAAKNSEFEIVQFMDAELQNDGSWKLSRLLRGQRGTNYEMSLGAESGSNLVILDGRIQYLPMSADDSGLEYNWRVGPSSYPTTSETYATLSYSASGRNTQMFSPAHLSLIANEEGYEFTWIRRGRRNADSWEGAEVPLDAAAEQYSVRILNAVDELIRETIMDKPSYNYPASLKEQDFGGPDPRFVIEVRQLNDAGLPGLSARLQVR